MHSVSRRPTGQLELLQSLLASSVHSYSSLHLWPCFITGVLSMFAAFSVVLIQFLNTIWSVVIRVTLFPVHAFRPSPSPPELPIATSPCISPQMASVVSFDQPRSSEPYVLTLDFTLNSLCRQRAFPPFYSVMLQ